MYSIVYGSIPHMVTIGDFNNDHQLDIAVTNFGTNSISIFLGFGNGTFSNKITFSINSSRPFWIDAADLNNDTALNIITVDYGTDSISVLYGYGNETFSHSIIYTTSYDSLPFAIIAGDFNSDHHLDLVVTNKGNEKIVVFLGYDIRIFASPKMYSTGSFSSIFVAVNDFNNNNQLDIIVVNNDTNSLGILLGYDEGLAARTTYSTGSSPNSIVIGDFNNDNHPDIVVTNYRSNNISVFLEYDNGSFTNQTAYSNGFNPKCVSDSTLSRGISKSQYTMLTKKNYFYHEGWLIVARCSSTRFNKWTSNFSMNNAQINS
jgi:hypothetical protein